MISRSQQILLKRAQAEAGLDDADYRDAIAAVAGMADCRSSKDPRLTDRHIDRLLAYMEAIHWKEVDAGALQPSSKANAVFRQRGFWAARNPSGSTSRDRFNERAVVEDIEGLEAALGRLGFGFGYFAAIKARVGDSGLVNYKAALKRTLAAKQRALQPVGEDSEHPF